MGRFSKLELGQPQPTKEQSGREAPPASPNARPEGSHDPHSLVRQGSDLLIRGEHREAMRLFGRALQLNSTLLEAWVGQIDSLIAMNQIREAEVWSGRALEQYPDDPTLLSIRGTILARQGMLKRAIGTSDYAMTQGHTVRSWICRSEILMMANNSNASFCMEKAIEMIEENDWESLMHVGLVYHRWSRWAQALEIFQRASAILSNRVELWLLIGECQARIGLTNQAHESFKRAQEIEPNNRHIEAMIKRWVKAGPLDRLGRRIVGIFKRR